MLFGKYLCHFGSHLEHVIERNFYHFLRGPQQRYIYNYEMFTIKIVDCRLKNVLSGHFGGHLEYAYDKILINFSSGCGTSARIPIQIRDAYNKKC